MDSSAFRFDFSPITRTETTEEGYLRVWSRAARTGIQLYRRADGSQVREYRPPEEVSKPESLATFGMKPVTLEHPSVLLDASNTSQFQKGYSGSQVRFTDGFVEVALVVTDAEAIQSVQRGDTQEVSAGYRVDYDPTPGETPEGVSFDGIQRNIKVNHIALVRKGRAGPQVRLLLDHMDSAAVAVPEPNQPLTTLSSPVMATINLDGLEIDLPAELASAVQSFVKDKERQVKALTDETADLSNKLDAARSEIETLAFEKDTAEGRADALEERLSESADPTDSRMDVAEIDALVAARLATLQRLAPAFDESFKFDGIGDSDLYKQAFSNLTGYEPPENASPDYIQGVVDGMLVQRADSGEESPEDEDEESPEDDEEEEALPPRSDSAGQLRSALRGAGAAKPVSSEAQRARLEDGWKKPLTANAR